MELFPDIAGQVSFGALRSSMIRARKATMPRIPATLQELAAMLPDNQRYRNTKDGQPFFLGSVTDVGGTSVIFGSPKFINMLPTTRELHMDGTFKVRPSTPPSRQILTIMAMHYSQAFPVFYVLMEKKTKAAYAKVFEFVKEISPQLSPEVIVSDFETALQQAAVEAFPESHVYGCWFHSSQAMRRKARALGLHQQMTENLIVKKAIKMTMALALLPPENILSGFESIVNYAEQQNILNILNPYFDYVRSVWIEGVTPVLLSVFRQKRRTNNDQEAYHKQLLGWMKSIHPNVWIFLDGLQKNEEKYSLKFESLQNGVGVGSYRKSSYLANDARIQQATLRFLDNDWNELEFLTRTSHAISDHIEAMEDDDDEDDDIGHVPLLDDAFLDEFPEQPAYYYQRGRGGRGGRGRGAVRGRGPQGNRGRGGRGRPRGGRLLRGGQGRGAPLPAPLPDGNENEDIAAAVDEVGAAFVDVDEAVDVAAANEIEILQTLYEDHVISLATLDIDVEVADVGEYDIAIRCVACLANKRSYMVQPCNHLVLCGPCTIQHRQGIRDIDNKLLGYVCCPQCRTVVQTYLKVFI